MEPVLATVHIENNTGRALDFSPNGNARLFFGIEERPSSTLAHNQQLLIERPVVIPNGDAREFTVDLLRSYSIRNPQPYMVYPRVEIDGTKAYQGMRRSLEVLSGMEILKKTYGIPGQNDAWEASLRAIHRDGGDRLFFRLDRQNPKMCLRGVELGRFVQLLAPQLQQDASGNFHVLHQMSPTRFVHSVFGPNGSSVETTFYSSTGGIEMVRDGGTWVVLGGTPFTVDPDNPGMLVAPALPSTGGFEMGAFPVKAKKGAEKPSKPKWWQRRTVEKGK